MIELSGRFSVPGVEGVAVFPDDRQPGGFYVVATVPRVAIDASGAPEVSLAVVGRERLGVVTASSALLTLTGELTVSEPDLARVRRLLAGRLAEQTPAGAGPPPEVVLLAPAWREASMTVRLTDAIELTQPTSLTSGNRCSFATKLTGPDAAALAEAWRDGLPGAAIGFTGRLAAGGAAGGSTFRSAGVTVTSTSTVTDPVTGTASRSGGSAAAWYAAQTGREPAAAADADLVEGTAPLGLAAAVLADRRTDVTL